MLGVILGFIHGEFAFGFFFYRFTPIRAAHLGRVPYPARLDVVHPYPVPRATHVGFPVGEFAGGGELRAPATRVTDFLEGRASSTVPKTSYVPGLTPSDVASESAREIRKSMMGI